MAYPHASQPNHMPPFSLFLENKLEKKPTETKPTESETVIYKQKTSQKKNAQTNQHWDKKKFHKTIIEFILC